MTLESMREEKQIFSQLSIPLLIFDLLALTNKPKPAPSIVDCPTKQRPSLANGDLTTRTEYVTSLSVRDDVTYRVCHIIVGVLQLVFGHIEVLFIVLTGLQVVAPI